MKICKNKISICALTILVGILFAACGKKEAPEEQDEYKAYAELSAEDWEVIDYVNQNIDCEFKLLEEMRVKEATDEGFYTELSPGRGEVRGVGDFIPEKDAPIRTKIYLEKPSEYNIFGVKYGDKYKEARELIEKSGFIWNEERPLGDTKITTFKKGIVSVELWSYQSDRENEDSEEISRISVSVGLEVESREDSLAVE